MPLAFVHAKPDSSSDDVRDRRWLGAPACDPSDRASPTPPLLPTVSSSSAKSSGSGRAPPPSALPRRLKRFLLLILVVSVAYLGTLVVEWELDRRRLPPTETDPADSAGQGIMFFAYGTEAATAEHYLEQAIVSARRIKSLNPRANITIVANPNVTPEMEDTFDVLINVDRQFLYSGRVQSWGMQGVSRQWLTRLEYLSCSPYKVTLALDSQALCCASSVNELLEQSGTEYDIAFATQGPKMLGPHNWAILYHMNDRTRRLFDRWRTLQIDYARDGTDQLTLHMAAGSLALQDKINVGVLSQNVALATVIYNRTGPEYPKTSSLIDPRPVHFVHYDAQSDEDADATCETLNKEPDRARVVMLPRPFPKDKETNLRIKNTYEMVYGEEELGAAANAARKNAAYFRDLDWENTLGKWGHFANPWKDHYPGCWKDLAKEVNVGVRHIYHDPSDLWANSHFAEEFSNDKLEWPQLS